LNNTDSPEVLDIVRAQLPPGIGWLHSAAVTESRRLVIHFTASEKLMELPQFKYHPAALTTGSIAPSDEVCEVYGTVRGYVYRGGTCGLRELTTVCPWCIADDSAHEKFGVEFTDRALIGGGDWETVSGQIADEVAFRTPGFSGWQQERWFTHCGDAAEFLGPMGKEELERVGPEAVDVVRAESAYDATQWKSYYNSLDAQRGPTAYLFKCRHCGKLGGYSDSH
jgi:uncharacterized protein CbrC (UPF0167 family)